jgi:N6-L-threonylcarbamoyladenine synthase
MEIKSVLAIETSCDDTSVAIVRADGFVEHVISASQDDVHAPFGGIVPEIACRNHSVQLLPLIDSLMKRVNKTWDQVDGIAVTNRPGLIGSLIVGLVTAKSLAQVLDKPLIGINHLEGHLLAPFLKDNQYAPPDSFTYPYLGLAISGGHTSIYDIQDLGKYKIIGATLDDAAGEAFDKFAKMIGLGFPGGVQVDRLSQNANAKKFGFPRAMIKEEHLNMSFSGLKSAGQRLVETWSDDEIKNNLGDLCASFQEAICEVLIAKLEKATKLYPYKNVILTGGVSANSRLRQLAADWAQKKGLCLVVPPLRYCTDNAAMIGYAGILRLNRGERSDLNLAPSPSPVVGDFIE